MLDDLIKAYGNNILVAVLGVSLALLCLFIVLWILRNRAPSPFVRGGRNRQPRLQVLDAAAVDTRRRIVLIRRDNVEHLVMIGGPTDIVIESGIGDERPYLSARPLPEQAIEDPSALPKSDAPQTLEIAEPAAPLIAAPSPAAAPVETPVRRPVVAETVKSEPPAPPARPVMVAPPAAEQRPPQAAPVRQPEPILERPANPAPAPVITATAALSPVATASVATAVEAAPQVRVETPAIASMSRPAPAVERPASTEPPAQPTAKPEPVVRAEPQTHVSQDAIEPVRREPEPPQIVPIVIRDVTADASPVEAVRVEPVDVATTDHVQPPVRVDVRRDDSDPARAGAEPVRAPLIDAPAAEDLLEAARLRVLAPPAAPVTAVPSAPQRLEPQIEAARPVNADEPATRDLSDFERVLEEEMALHLAADPAPAAKPVPTISPILPDTRADRPRPPVTAVLPEGNRPTATAQNSQQQGQEPNLQTEIARIFGEMSASRNP